jgi:Protein of unknown function (DUF1559)
MVRTERELAAIRAIEAMRFYAARHEGKLPKKLEDVAEVPVPLDPVTGKMFDYKLDDNTATIEGGAPAGRNPRDSAFRYIVTIADAKSAGTRIGRRVANATSDTSANVPASANEAQKVMSEIAKALTDIATTNPIRQFGESHRRARSIDNLRILSLALTNYHDVNKHFPPAASADRNGKPLLSWRVHILPFLDEEKLYRQFKLDEPWDSEHNKKLIEKMPDVFRVPALPPLRKYTTSYVVPVGQATIFHDNQGTPLKEVIDGTANTILVLEADADQSVVWTKPGDWEFDAQNSARGLGSLRRDCFLAALADCSVRQFDLKRDKARLPALFTRAGGEKAGP